MTDDGKKPWTRSARELAAEIAAGELSATEAVESHIARIEEVNAKLNAVVWKRYEAARAEAKAADARRAAKEPLGPLHGVPITVKECLDLEGSPSTFGIVARKDHRAAIDEPHVARLRAAGAIVLGKTNVAQLLMYLESDNPVYGLTRNPWAGDRTPGGSSGGQAAVVAAGGSPLGLGTDIGGSNRVPAAFCGVVGFKPTTGRTPDMGRGSIPVGQQAIRSQVGVFARDVADAELGLRIAAGGTEGVPPLGDPASVAVASLRVGWFDDDSIFAPTPASRRAVAEAAEILGRLGARVTAWRPPDPEAARGHFYGLLAADRFAGERRALGSTARDPRIKLLEDAATLPRPVVDLMLWATGRRRTAEIMRYFGPYDTDTYWRRVEALMDYQAKALSELGDIDVVLSPASPLPALRHGASAEVGVMGIYSNVYNVLGWPAGVIPFTRVRAGEGSQRPVNRDPHDVAARETERAAEGMPIGVQLAARPWRDHVALAAMAALEREARGRDGYPATPVYLL
jgi:fatty acid amide hydrolase